MSSPQLDLFAPAPKAPPAIDPQILDSVRARLHATLALVRDAQTMPWNDMLTIIHQDNGFRAAKDLLPPEEGAGLWAEFDAHMDRLYAILNQQA